MSTNTHNTSDDGAAKGAAFFDLDGTLIPFNSGLKYARFEVRAGRLSRLAMGRTAFWMMLYHFSLIDITKAYGRAVAHHQGMAEEDLVDRTQRFFDDEVAAALLPAASAALARHRDEGRARVLLSSTSSYLAAASTERWGLDGWLANRFPTSDDGLLAGTFEAPLCYGPGKVDHARAWAEPRAVDLAESWFYTDSYSDVPMLEAVGHPVVVNPDPRLRRHARRRGWPVEQWRPVTR